MSDKMRLELEYMINTSPKVLYDRLSNPSGLSEWFADDVNLKGDIYTFIWDGSEQQAELLNKKANKHVRFRWLDDEDSVFEFIIDVDDLTGDVALTIVDTIDEDEEEETRELWDSQISELKHILGV